MKPSGFAQTQNPQKKNSLFRTTRSSRYFVELGTESADDGNVILSAMITRRLETARSAVISRMSVSVSVRRPFATDDRDDNDRDDNDRDNERDRSLISLMTMIDLLKQRRRHASDQYVSRFLNQLGSSALDVDAFVDAHAVYSTQLSVKRDLEPVVMFLMSTGLSKEEVGRIAAKAPLVFRKDPAELFARYEWLRYELGSDDKARGMLLRRPEVFAGDGSLDDFRSLLEIPPWVRGT